MCERGDELTESVGASWGGASGCSMVEKERERERGGVSWRRMFL